jgi:hypothetical protein
MGIVADSVELISPQRTRFSAMGSLSLLFQMQKLDPQLFASLTESPASLMKAAVEE